ncbi:ABC transporter permease [Schlesneria sp. DSM 10557]|uniref:ABC transporter permease n=1 Tax=Schlesneria sp. DSM 10557 TaxID=3044399 RepID=UPI00359FCB7F
MATYLLKRILLMIPTMFGILLVSFLVIRLAPGDPAAEKFGGAGQASAGVNAERGTEAAEKRFRERHGFDKPLPHQFMLFLNRLVQGDMIFFQTEQKIWPELWDALKVTMLLNLIVFTLIYVAAIPLGILSAAYPRHLFDRVSTVFLFVLYSLPSFWVAELLRELFMQKWIWTNLGFSNSPLPILGLKSQNFDSMTSFEQFVDYAKHIVLPVLCMTYGGLAYVSRQMRAGMLEVIRQDYIRTAEAKGCSKPRVILVHALRNSLFPIITLLASLLPFLVGGSVIIEVIFNIHGMGLLSYEGVLRREYDLVMTTLMLSAVLTLLGILVSDILYVVVNPRVSFEDK